MISISKFPRENPKVGGTPPNAVVIGGGIVGVCCALYLQRTGQNVTLIDPAAPGDSTAKWSCGQMAVGEIVPLSKPGILHRVPGWLLDQRGPLALRPSAAPRLLPWFIRFLASARAQAIREIATALAGLTKDVYADYAPLFERCGRRSMLRTGPVIEVFDSPAGIEHEAAFLALREELGFQVQRLSGAEVSDLEPCLNGRFKSGLLFPDWRCVADTEDFIADLTQSFIAGGGVRIQAQVEEIEERDGMAVGVRLGNAARVPASHCVVAAGIGSRRFFKALGVSAPLEGVAGYQAVLKDAGVEFRHSVIYADGGFSFSPMRRGLQIGGTIEFSGRNALPNYKRAQMIVEKAKRVIPDLKVDDVEFGVGYRPFLPDTKPIIDQSRRLVNVYMAFGHGQLGLTLGATTGRLISELVQGVRSLEQLKPFSAYRF